MLSSWWSKYCEQFFLDRIGFDLSWEEGIIRHIQLMFTNSDFLFAANMNSGSGLPLTEGETVSRRIIALENALNYRHIPLTEELEFSVDVYAHCFVERANDFLKHPENTNYGITPTARLFLAIIPPLLYSALQLKDDHSSQLENYARIDEIALEVLNKPLVLQRHE